MPIAPTIVVLLTPPTVSRFAPLDTVPLTVRVLLLLVQVWAAPRTTLGLIVTPCAPLLIVMPVVALAGGSSAWSRRH